MSKEPSKGRGKDTKPTTKPTQLSSKFAETDSSDSDYDQNDNDDDLGDWLVKDVEDDEENDIHTALRQKDGTKGFNHFKKAKAGTVNVFAGLDLQNSDFSSLLGSNNIAPSSSSASFTNELNNLLTGAKVTPMSDDFELDNLFKDTLRSSVYSFAQPTPTKRGIVVPDDFMCASSISPKHDLKQKMEMDQDVAEIYDDPILNPTSAASPAKAAFASSNNFTPTVANTPTINSHLYNQRRQFDQKTGISIIGTVTEKDIAYAHESIAKEEEETAAVNDAIEALVVENKGITVDLKQLNQSGDDHLIYIYNMYEDTQSKDGKMYLFGRILLQNDDTTSTPGSTAAKIVKQESMITKSICIVVQRVDRQLFFLPRKHPLNGRTPDLSTIVSLDDVKKEINDIFNSYDITEKRIKVSEKKYCFGRRVHPKRFTSTFTFNDVKTNKFKTEDELFFDDDDIVVENNIMMNDHNTTTTTTTIPSPTKANLVFLGKLDESLLDPINIIPAKAKYIEVRYPANSTKFPQNLTGSTFSHVLGTQTSRQESLILDRKLLGPNWVRIPKSQCQLHDNHAISWCDFEMTLPDARHITVYQPASHQIDYPPPLFTAVSLSLKTALHVNKNNTWEKTIVMATLKHDYSMNIDVSKTKDQQLRVYQNTWTIVTLPQQFTRFPHDFEEKRLKYIQTREKLTSEIQVAPSEAKLLSLLLHKINVINPDILVGHDLHGSMLDVLISRIAYHKLGLQWSKLGRIKRSVVPKPSRREGHSYVDVGAGAGRVMCDTQLSAREFYPSKQYTLDHLAEHLLDLRIKVIDQGKIAEAFSTTRSLMELILVNIVDSEAQFKLMHQLDVIPLTKQLTNLCGNTWHSSLRAVRSLRVEYLLLHHFTREDFIPPEPVTRKSSPFNTYELDHVPYSANMAISSSSSSSSLKTSKTDARKNNKKSNSKNNFDDDTVTTARTETEDADGYFEDNALQESDDEDARNNNAESKDNANKTAADKKKKGPSYRGGKVLEPKRGFYNDWIAVLDFNSLYPSIIREYNFCFSTTQHWTMDLEDENCNLDDLAPGPDVSVGILPEVVRMLIERRRAVRKLIPMAKDLKEVQQYNIKQLAFKLVANSLYGCLGFENSRFFCRPIASAVTHKGRLALDKAVQEAANIGAKIIYGDTDSIMVDTQRQTYKDARAVAVKLKTNISKNYKVLNIDEDGYFKNMLLLRKKKYAAMKLERFEKYDEKKYTAWCMSMNMPGKEVDRRKYMMQVMPNIITTNVDGTPTGLDLQSSEITENKDLHDMFYFKREIKGLDMIRRDWSNLCRSASDDILHILLRDTGKRDETITAIRDALSNINTLMTENRLDLDYFVITKQLTRSLQNYSDASKLPHVAVANKMSKQGRPVRAGDVIEYVMTTSQTQNTSSTNSSSIQSDRACSKQDYANYIKHTLRQQELAKAYEENPKNAGQPSYVMEPYLDYPVDMALDLIYYKEQQLLAPVMRLVEVLDEVTTSSIAQCLGLDAAKYAMRERQAGKRSSTDINIDLAGNNVVWSKLLKDPYVEYGAYPPFYICCPNCSVSFPFMGVFSYTNACYREQYEAQNPADKAQFVFRNLPFKMHTPAYVNKLNQSTQYKTGFICPTPGCPGVFNNWTPPNAIPLSCTVSLESIIAMICNCITQSVREMVIRFEQRWMLYHSKEMVHNTHHLNQQPQTAAQYRSKELMIKGMNPVRLCFTQYDLLSYLNYLLFLFDYSQHRQLLQRESDNRLISKIGEGKHSSVLYEEVVQRLPENVRRREVKTPSDATAEMVKMIELTAGNRMRKVMQITPNPNANQVAMNHPTYVPPNPPLPSTITTAAAHTEFPETFWIRGIVDEPQRKQQDQHSDGNIQDNFDITRKHQLCDLSSSIDDDILVVVHHVTAHIKNILRHNEFNTMDLFKIFQ